MLQLDAEIDPGADFAGAYFCLYQDTYLLPSDYIGGDQMMYERNFGGMDYVPAKEWLYENRYIFAEGTPQAYTITGDPQYPGRLVCRMLPFPVDQRSVDFIYNRRPRPLELLSSLGKANCSAGSTTVAGLATNWGPGLVGSVIRLSGTSKLPTASIGENPASVEGTITAVDAAGSLEIDGLAAASLANAPFEISDPVDIEPGAMLTAFLRGIECQLAQTRTLKDKPSALPLYRAALVEAKQADSRSFAGRSVGDQVPYRMRLRDMPFTFTVE